PVPARSGRGYSCLTSPWAQSHIGGLVEIIFFFKQKTAYEIGLGIPAEPLFRSAVGALRLSPLRRGLAIDSTVDIFTFYVPHRHVYGEQWIKFMKDGVNATPLPTVNTTGYIDHAAFLG